MRGLRAESVAEGLRLTWSHDTPQVVRQYRVYRAETTIPASPTGPPYLIVRRPGLVDAAAQQGHSYDYRVIAVNAEGTPGAFSPDVSAAATGGKPTLVWDKYGGFAAGPKQTATGFFRVAKVDDRWILVDPEGRPFFSTGLDVVGFGDSVTKVQGREAQFAKFVAERDAGKYLAAWSGEWGAGGAQTHFSEYVHSLVVRDGADFLPRWRKSTVARMKAWGINSFGAWCDGGIVAEAKLPYVSFAGGSGNTPTLMGNLPDVYDERFEAAVKQDAVNQCTPRKGDPLLIGWFSANENPWFGEWEQGRSIAELILNKDGAWACKRAAVDLLKGRYETIAKLNDAWGLQVPSWDEALNTPALSAGKTVIAVRDKTELRRLFAERYFQITTAAIKAADPNHLTLGARFAGDAPQEVVAAAGKFCDVVSFNCYPPEFPRAQFDRFYRSAGKPIIIGEFAFRGVDSGLPNTRAAGLIVPTQTDRGLHYAEMVGDLLDTGYIVGCHWFQYIDEPATGRFDGEDSNMGWVNAKDEPYTDFVSRAAVTDLNWPLQAFAGAR